MKLKEFYEGLGLTAVAMAKMLDVTSQTIANYNKGAIPRKNVMKKINIITKGKVTYSDFAKTKRK